MRDGEPNVYAGLATIRNGYTQMQWQRVQMFLVFNTVALPVVFGSEQPDLGKLVISMVGLIVHGLLLVAVLRAEQWISFLDEKLAALESQDPSTEKWIRVSIFSDLRFHKKRASWFSSRRIFNVLGVTMALLWSQQIGQLSGLQGYVTTALRGVP